VRRVPSLIPRRTAMHPSLVKESGSQEGGLSALTPVEKEHSHGK